MTTSTTLLTDIRTCTLCSNHLPLGPRPVLQLHPNASILIVGQAPGRRVHETGIPFNDPSGVRLREWMGIREEVFYDPKGGRHRPHRALLSRQREIRRQTTAEPALQP